MAIPRWPLPLRLALLTLLFIAPPAVIGWLALRPFDHSSTGEGLPWSAIGALAGIQLGWTLLLALALRAERSVARAHGAVPSHGTGLRRALDRVLATRAPAGRPVIAVFADPRPAALVVRGLGGAGTILLSQGLTTQFGEREIESVLGRGLDRLGERGVIATSLGATINLALARALPRAWTRIFFGGAQTGEGPGGSISFAVFLALLPWLRLVGALTATRSALPSPADPEAWRSAMHKIVAATSIGGNLTGFGADPLYLVPPRAANALLPGAAPVYAEW